MIIYNLQTLLAVIIIIPIAIVLSDYNSNFETLGMPEFWGIALFVSCLLTGFGFKPRLYLIPLWLFSFIVFIWRSFVVYNSIEPSYAIILALIFIAIGISIRLFFVKRNWEKSKKLLLEFKSNKKTSNPELLAYYPSYIYAKNPLADKYLDYLFKYFQSNWFAKKEVTQHYLSIIEILIPENLEEKVVQNLNFLKHLFEEKKIDKIPEHLLISLKTNLPKQQFTT